MKSKEDKLFRLVQTMTPSESAQFKKGKNNPKADYIQLFDIVKSMPEYNKADFNKRAKKKLPVTSLPRVKNYLYNLLIDFLVDYHRNTSIQGEVLTLTDRARILFFKGLFDECKETIDEARKITQDYELLIPLLQLNELEWNLNNLLADKKMLRYQELYKEKEIIIHSIDMYYEYRKLNVLMINLFKQAHHSSANPEIASKAKELMNAPIMQKAPANDAPFYFKYVYLATLHRFRSITGNTTNELEHLEQWIDLWTSKIHMKETLHMTFFDTVSKYLVEACKRKYFIRFPDLISLMDAECKILNTLVNTHAVSKYLLIKSQTAMCQGNLAPAIQMGMEMQDLFKKNKNPDVYIEQYLTAKILLAILNLLKSEIKLANKYLNWLLNNCPQQHTDVLFKVKILRMMTADDDGEFFYLGELVNSFTKLCKTKKRQHKIETAFINYFQKISHSNSQNERNEFLRELKSMLSEQFETNELEDYFLFDPLVWIDSKLRAVSATDIFKERALDKYPEIFSIKF